MILTDYLEQYDELVPFMDEDSRKYLARCIQSGETPDFNPFLLAQWVQQSENKKRQSDAFWKHYKERCKTNRAKK